MMKKISSIYKQIKLSLIDKNEHKTIGTLILFNLIIVVMSTFILTSTISASSTYKRPGPYFDVEVKTNIDEIWPTQSNKKPNTCRVNLSFQAKGREALIFDPQNTMLILDCSQSMRINDPNQTMISSTKGYIDNMNYPDEAGIVKMSSNGSLVQNLTGNYEILKNKLELSTEPGGRTNFERSINLATDELLKNADPDKKRIEILLTDGRATDNVTEDTIKRVRDKNITIYPIGFGEDVNSNLLKWIANETEGKYHHLNNLTSLEQVYLDISNREYTNSTGEDLDLKINFEEHISVDPNSFTVSPTNITDFKGKTNVSWDFNKTFVLGESWNVRFNISTDKKGKQSVYSNRSGIYYTRPWDDRENFTSLPDLQIMGKVKRIILLPPPPPPPTSPSPPPVEAFPISTSPMATTTIVPQATLQPIAQTAGYQALFAPLLGLGVGEVLKGNMKVGQEEGISMSSGKKPDEEEKSKEVENLGYTFNER